LSYSIQASLPVVTCGRSIPCGQYQRGKLCGFLGELRLLFYVVPSRQNTGTGVAGDLELPVLVKTPNALLCRVPVRGGEVDLGRSEQPGSAFEKTPPFSAYRDLTP